ncbi:hypothetical protein ACFS5L_04865 [Streptomyces phyllanthi]|uniref:Uncharacterized protein n=1 Tax=Streptomyces phyllanthi TaxID=1803180 RepID=A0A5N8W4Y4_9ACTN|nr:hypothetical protein [Streptomyces phyllanthi]MPY41374.1 hypothetical protein [Streptomyces phyllanthi]
MTDHRSEGPGENGEPVPRDMPDQQAGAGEDPWEVDSAPGETDEGEAPATDVPDTDEAGSGRKGAPKSGGVHPEQPVPNEVTD